MIWVSSTDFRKLLKYQISWKSARWKLSCSMRTDGRTDGQTDKTKLMIVFRKFANAPETGCVAKQHITIMFLYVYVCIPSLQIKPCFTSHEQDHADVLRWDTVKLLWHICSSVSEQPGSHTHYSARKWRHKPPFPRPETFVPIYQNYTTPLAA